MGYRTEKISTGKIPDHKNFYLYREEGVHVIVLAELRVSEREFWEHLMNGLGLPFRFDGEPCDGKPDSRR
jgi:hypothetical protein